MDCERNYYQCKNLVYFDDGKLTGYFCTISCKRCKFHMGSSGCLCFEEDREE